MSKAILQSELIPEETPVESASLVEGLVVRSVLLRNGSVTQSTTQRPARRRGRPPEKIDLAYADLALLQEERTPELKSDQAPMRVVDLFCGVGGTSVGAYQAGRALNRTIEFSYAIDFDELALSVYENNFPKAKAAALDLSQLSSVLGSTKTPLEIKLAREIEHSPDVMLAGPPCQGHSNLNNYTRGNDPKNELYFKVVRAVELLRPRTLLIENVASVIRDRRRALQRSIIALQELGYRVHQDVVDCSKIGVAQTRKRHILVAVDTKDQHFASFSLPSVGEITKRYSVPTRSLQWAIGDLVDADQDPILDRTPETKPETQQRIDYLFENDLWDLPDSQRPDCHKNKAHNYGSVYGRMHWKKPAPTITSGYFTMGQGRFVHPERRRTLTAHEAARIQFFPDWFRWAPLTTRKSLALGVGNAVPPKLSYVFLLELFR